MSRLLPTRPRDIDQLSGEVQFYIEALEDQVEQLRLKLQEAVRRDENRMDQQALKVHANVYERSDESMPQEGISDEYYEDDEDSHQPTPANYRTDIMQCFINQEMLAIARDFRARPKDSNQ